MLQCLQRNTESRTIVRDEALKLCMAVGFCVAIVSSLLMAKYTDTPPLAGVCEYILPGTD